MSEEKRAAGRAPGRPFGSRMVIEDRFDIMPLAEIGQRLLKYRGRREMNTQIGWSTIAKKVGIHRNVPRWLATGVYTKNIVKYPDRRMSDNRQRLLSRLLRQLETGELTFSKKQWHQHAATKPLPRVSRVVVLGDRVAVQQGASQSATTLPSFGSILGLTAKPQLPKHFLGGK